MYLPITDEELEENPALAEMIADDDIRVCLLACEPTLACELYRLETPRELVLLGLQALTDMAQIENTEHRCHMIASLQEVVGDCYYALTKQDCGLE